MAQERGWCGRFLTLNRWQMLGLVVYALLFPLSQKLGGRFADIGLFVTFPFVPVGYVIGDIQSLSAWNGCRYIFSGLAVADLCAWRSAV